MPSKKIETATKHLAKLFDQYLQNTKDDWNYITPNQLYRILYEDEGSQQPCFLLDVRKRTDYLRG